MVAYNYKVEFKIIHTHTHTHTQGYKQWKGFIITQAPMKSTCRDFWKMVYERECGVIVMLSDLVENGEVGDSSINRVINEFPNFLYQQP